MAKQKILIIDDEVMLARLTAKRLSSVGFEVTCCTDFKNIITLVQTTMPDLVLLDIMLPGTSGYDVLAKIRSNKKLCNIPIIFFTAMSDKENKQIQLANDYVQKPYQPNDLINTIKKALSICKE